MAKSRIVKASSSRMGQIVERLLRFQVEVPSWGFANTGTRFGKFNQAAAAVDLEDKLQDAGVTNEYTGVSPSVAVHVLWDFPKGFDPAVVKLAKKYGVRIGAINPNLFQDQCYKWGSVTNRDASVRGQAVQHMIDSVEIGRQTGSEYLSLWFADGTNYPGQADIRQRKAWATVALQKTYRAMPENMTMLVEYKPFEPACYFTDFFDWGSSYVFCKACGDRAKVLVDTGHHLSACNIEQIVAWLIDEGMLGGFHFNDRKYADDDLNFASIDPYQSFRIFSEIAAYEWEKGQDLAIAYMIDQSHNLEPKVQAMVRTVCRVQELFAKALCVDRKALADAQASEDVVLAEETLRAGFHTDVTPILGEVRKKLGVPANPLLAFRESGYEKKVAKARDAKRKALGAGEGASYA